MITPTRIAEIRARLEAATPGPWRHTNSGESIHPQKGLMICGMAQAETEREADRNARNFDLIANAPADLADLLAALDAAQAERQEDHDILREAFNAYAPTEAKGHTERPIGRAIVVMKFLSDKVRIYQAERDAATARAVAAEAEATALRAEVARLGPEQVEREFQGHWTSVSDDNPIEHAALLKGIGVKLRTIRVVQEGAGDAT
jgi:hypothetical protein